MLRRNLDFLALMLVVGGMGVIDGIPRLEQRVLTKVASTLPMPARCPLQVLPVQPVTRPAVIVRDLRE